MCIIAIGFLFYIKHSCLELNTSRWPILRWRGTASHKISSHVHSRFWWPQLGMVTRFKQTSWGYIEECW